MDGLVDRAPAPAALRAHGLHLLAARRWRELDLPIAADVLEDERLARLRSLAVPAILARIRAACRGPIVLMKGFEVASRYPDQSLRPFQDIDLLVPDPEGAVRELRAAGFQPVGYDDAHYAGRHHLRPLWLPELPIVVEVHHRPEWVPWCTPPAPAELVQRAVESRCGVDGILAPAPSHHALMLAAHSWAGAPIRRILDLVDTALLSKEVERGEIERWSSVWGIEGLWSLTSRVQDTLFAGAPAPRPLRLWGSSVLAVREATVLEHHLRRLLAPFAVLPPRRALRQSAGELFRYVTPAEGEEWRTKLARSRLAIRDAFVARSDHDRQVAKLPRGKT